MVIGGGPGTGESSQKGGEKSVIKEEYGEIQLRLRVLGIVPGTSGRQTVFLTA